MGPSKDEASIVVRLGAGTTGNLASQVRRQKATPQGLKPNYSQGLMLELKLRPPMPSIFFRKLFGR
jgi:hypothetical protein